MTVDVSPLQYFLATTGLSYDNLSRMLSHNPPQLEATVRWLEWWKKRRWQNCKGQIAYCPVHEDWYRVTNLAIDFATWQGGGVYGINIIAVCEVVDFESEEKIKGIAPFTVVLVYRSKLVERARVLIGNTLDWEPDVCQMDS